jgi:2-methylisocitrate lyase-like PEP mutase family enzyme
VDLETYISRIRAASAARKRINSDIVLIARTDALAVHGIDEAIRRLQEAVKAGADAAFLEGITTAEEARKVCSVMKQTNTPVLLNLIPGGMTPNWSVNEAREMGFRIMIVPLMLLEVVEEAATKALRGLKETGRAEDGKQGPRGLSMACGLLEAQEIDREAGGKSLGSI